MADLLASLEAGFDERTNVGAASRLRNQVIIIDKFMADQRHAELHQDPFSQSIPNHGLPKTRSTRNQSMTHQRNIPNLSSVSDANIDPSLQSTAPPTIKPSTGAGVEEIHQSVGAPGFDYTTNGAVNGVGGMNGAPGDEQFQFQIPPELLEGWPWPTGAGFGGL
jgi:hypothetical protein